jgi:hypothetical protein
MHAAYTLAYLIGSAAGGGSATTPTFVAAGAGVDVATAGTLAVPYAGSLATGDLFVIQLFGRQKSTDPTTPAGWTLRYGPDTNSNASQWVYTCDARASGSESGTVSLTTGNANMWAARMYAFRNVATSSFLEAATTVNGSSGVCGGPSITTLGTHRLLVACYGIDTNAAMAANVGATGGTWVEAVAEYATGTGSNAAMQLQTLALASAGAVSGGSSNFGGGSDDSICRAFALIGV